MWVQDLARVYRWRAFKKETKFQALISGGELADQEVLLALPQTFMNMSGESVASLLRFYKLTLATDLLLVFDDLDLSLGRFKLGQSFPRGHNGVLNVQDKLGKLGWALRLGVDDRAGARVIGPAAYVLQDFSATQLSLLADEIFPQTRTEVITKWLLKK
jgi:PTH1 family peptidyl-tRNA hydrolase